tara:strand:+ start:607 stop:1050 length:444 start_codon:yes stop_codon:yes gene_type:complete
MAEQWRYLGRFVYNGKTSGPARKIAELAEEGMVKGVFVALGIMVLLALIPIVDVIGIPFGAFIGAYYGISSTGDLRRSFLFKSVMFGGLLGVLVFLLLVAVAAGLTMAVDLSQRFQWLLWLSVFTFTLYSASMGALGAMYSQLKKSG